MDGQGWGARARAHALEDVALGDEGTELAAREAAHGLAFDLRDERERGKREGVREEKMEKNAAICQIQLSRRRSRNQVAMNNRQKGRQEGRKEKSKQTKTTTTLRSVLHCTSSRRLEDPSSSCPP